MSLIQEALKRKQEEERGDEGSPPALKTADPDQTPAQDPIPLASGIDEESGRDEDASAQRSGGRPWMILLGVVAVLVVLIGGGGGALYYAVKQIHKQIAVNDVAMAPVPVKAATATPPPSFPPSPKPATEVRDLPKPAVSVPAAVTAAASIPPPTPPPATPIAPVKLAANTTAPTPPVTPPVPVAVKPPTPPAIPPENPVVASVSWPPLTLSGIAGSGREASVIINHQVIGCDEVIDGVRVVDITAQGVVLEYQGHRQILRVGNSTK